MDLSYTEVQEMLRDSVSSFLSEAYDFEKREKALKVAPNWRPDIWKSFAEELQILGASFSEDFEGFGGNAIDNLVLMEEFGKSLVVEPYLPTVVMVGGVLKRSESPIAGDLIKKIISGEEIYSFGYSERNGRYTVSHVETRAQQDGDGWVIDGHKKLVLCAPYADKIFITARTSGDIRDEDGISIFMVDAKANGLTLNSYTTYDGFLAADITLDGVKLGPDALIGQKDKGFRLADRALDDATSAICGEAVGVIQKLLDLTVQYSKDRNQFGQPLSKFQSLQHRMVDMFVDLQQAKSIALLAAISTDSDDDDERKKGVSTAKAHISNALRRVGQSAIQIHGGMGITDEMSVSHYFKRSTILENYLGSADYHYKRIENLEA